jgi:hypothetical protein
MKQHEDCVMWTGILGNPGNHIPTESVGRVPRCSSGQFFHGAGGLSPCSRDNVTIMYRKEVLESPSLNTGGLASNR